MTVSQLLSQPISQLISHMRCDITSIFCKLLNAFWNVTQHNLVVKSGDVSEEAS